MNIKKALISRRDYLDYEQSDIEHLPEEAKEWLAKFVDETVHFDFRHEDMLHSEEQKSQLYHTNYKRNQDIYKSIQREYITAANEVYDRTESADVFHEDHLIELLEAPGMLLEGPEFPSPYCFCLADQRDNCNLDIVSRRAIVHDIGQAYNLNRSGKRKYRNRARS